jgi:hypothetical protein
MMIFIARGKGSLWTFIRSQLRWVALKDFPFEGEAITNLGAVPAKALPEFLRLALPEPTSVAFATLTLDVHNVPRRPAIEAGQAVDRLGNAIHLPLHRRRHGFRHSA